MYAKWHMYVLCYINWRRGQAQGGTTCSESLLHIHWAYTSQFFIHQRESLTWVTLGDPRHNVDNKLTIVDTEVLFFESGVAPPPPLFSPGTTAAFANRSSNSLVRPCSAKGAGSTARRVKRSARDAKQRKAPSETCKQVETCLPVIIVLCISYNVHLV